MLEFHCRSELDQFTLDIKEAVELVGVTALFGPSGSGKTSVLRFLAGLDRTWGHVQIDGETWQDDRSFVPPHRRAIGYLSQVPQLFSHLNVSGNLLYPIRRKRLQHKEQVFDTVVDVFSLSRILSRRVHDLSGGETQRVALARTVLTNPRLLLLDEPLTALDAARKLEILPYLERLAAEFRIPTILVSHVVDEVARLSDRIVVIDHGRVRVRGSTIDVIETPEFQDVTSRFESGVVIMGTVGEHDARYHLMDVHVGQVALVVPSIDRIQPGEQIRLRIRSRDVSIALTRPVDISVRNILEGRVVQVGGDEDSPYADVLVDVDGLHLRSLITRASVESLRLKEGTEVFALVKSVTFDADSTGHV